MKTLFPELGPRYRRPLAKLIDKTKTENLAWHRAIIAKLMSPQASPLTVNEQVYVALTLEELWLPKGELRALQRQRTMALVENSIKAAKWAYKNRRGRRFPVPPPIETVAEEWGFKSAGALRLWLKRRKKPPR